MAPAAQLDDRCACVWPNPSRSAGREAPWLFAVMLALHKVMSMAMATYPCPPSRHPSHQPLPLSPPFLSINRDLRLVKELVSGATRWRRRLDYVIREITGREADSLEASMRQVGAGRGH